jgi:hypothetical protein
MNASKLKARVSRTLLSFILTGKQANRETEDERFA